MQLAPINNELGLKLITVNSVFIHRTVNQTLIMLLIRIFLLSLLFSFSVVAEEEETPQEQEELTTAPNWSLKKEETVYGSEQLQGKPYVIHFWATWCPYCKRLQPGLESVSRDYKDLGIPTYAISFWETDRAKPIKEMKSRGLDLNVLVKGDEVAKSFRIEATPATIFIDHNGEILAKLNTSDPNDPQLRLAYEQLKDNFKAKDAAKPAEEDSE